VDPHDSRAEGAVHYARDLGFRQLVDDAADSH
jgi:hypothetical protein